MLRIFTESNYEDGASVVEQDPCIARDDGTCNDQHHDYNGEFHTALSANYQRPDYVVP